MKSHRNNKNDRFIEEKLYSPVFVKICTDENLEDYGDPLTQQTAAYYFDEIHYAILKERLAIESERGLMEYFSYHDSNNAVDDKVYSLFVNVEVHDEKLWGDATIRLSEPLTHDEYDDLKDYILGQYSDGFGEGFEQREIRTDDGELYVSLWDSGDEFFIDRQTEFVQRTGLDYLSLEESNFALVDIPKTKEAETDVAELKQQLVDRAFQNWEDFRNTPLESTPDSLFRDAVKVIGRRDACYLLKNYEGYTAEQLNCLLQFANPVELVGDYLDPSCDISAMPGVLENIIEEQEKYRKHYALVSDKSVPEAKVNDQASVRAKGLDLNEKPSLLAQIREAQHAAREKSISPKEPMLRSKTELEL